MLGSTQVISEAGQSEAGKIERRSTKGKGARVEALKEKEREEKH
jgi:hypothetical protein